MEIGWPAPPDWSWRLGCNLTCSPDEPHAGIGGLQPVTRLHLKRVTLPLIPDPRPCVTWVSTQCCCLLMHLEKDRQRCTSCVYASAHICRKPSLSPISGALRGSLHPPSHSCYILIRELISHTNKCTESCHCCRCAGISFRGKPYCNAECRSNVTPPFPIYLST